MIDNFFSMYGYAINQLAVPNVKVRPHWTYIKTKNCCITGSITTTDMNKICDIHNNGITYWMNGDEVGNYSLDNSPVSE